MGWRIAESLKVLRKQIDRAFPARSKKSDGSVGDLSHSKRKSDHNPNADGVVTAIDITHDPETGVDCEKLAKALFDSKDARIKYIIWNRKITNPEKTGWKAYRGANAHAHHLHLSVHSQRALFDSKTEWNLTGLIENKTPSASERITRKNPLDDQSFFKKEELAKAGLEPAKVEPEPETNEAAAPPPNESTAPEKPIVLTKEKTSTFVRVWTGITAGIGSLTAIGINAETVFNRAIENITANHVFGLAVAFALVALALWFYDKSAQRANALNQLKADVAADKGKNTVEFVLPQTQKGN